MPIFSQAATNSDGDSTGDDGSSLSGNSSSNGRNSKCSCPNIGRFVEQTHVYQACRFMEFSLALRSCRVRYTSSKISLSVNSASSLGFRPSSSLASRWRANQGSVLPSLLLWPSLSPPSSRCPLSSETPAGRLISSNSSPVRQEKKGP